MLYKIGDIITQYYRHNELYPCPAVILSVYAANHYGLIYKVMFTNLQEALLYESNIIKVE